MRKTAIVGIIILILGIKIISYYSGIGIHLEGLSVIEGIIDRLNMCCAGVPMPMVEELVINVPTKVSLEESVIVEVEYQQSGFHDRVVTIKTSGTNFDIIPNQAVSRKVGKAPERWVWVLSPKKLGEQSLLLQFSGISSTMLNDSQQGHSALLFDDSMEEQVNNNEYQFAVNVPIVYTIEVVDTFGLKAKEGEFLGYIISFLGFALTLPWLYSFWEKRREQKFKIEMEALQKENQKKIDQLEQQIKDMEVKHKKKQS